MVQTQLTDLSHLLKEMEKAAKQAAFDMDTAVTKITNPLKRAKVKELVDKMKSAKTQDEAQGYVSQINAILCQ
jgi:hypothetical protein